ncbi:MAG: signal peptide peptidase SppA [Pseudomonadota bacterium]|nr:signal peptide peptidase SppA [Pseudomonadota bacterium]MDE3037292.1 signal peptide peptidase SppA [Pseudomonadota bacterium]
MSLNADTLLDRLYLKTQITRWRVLAVLFAVIAGVVAVYRFSPYSPIEAPYVARLSFDGIIDDDQKTYDLIDSLGDNGKVKAVIVWLDTPGGSAVGGEETFLRLRQLAEKKPVVAVERSVAASAGYMVALGADRIYARPGTITGSIGVLIETAEITDLAEKLGIKPIIIKSSPLKAMPSPFEKDTPESDTVIKTVIMDFYNRFVDIVAERRHLPRDTVLKLADGRVYSGQAAVEDKLVDAIGGEKEAMDWLVEKRHIRQGLDIRDVDPEQETSLLDRLTQSIAGNFFNRSSVTLDGLVAVWHPRLH